MHEKLVIPYWGVPDSNINWCEGDYEFTPYVAEFMNAISSIPIALYGLFGLYYYRRYALNETRFNVSFLFLTIVGCGSTAFHATLRRYAQCLDELPMLFAAVGLLYNAIDYKTGFPTSNSSCISIRNSIVHRFWLKVSLIIGTIIITTIYFYIPNLFIVFFIGYSSALVTFIVLMSISIYSKNSKFSPLPRYLFWYSFLGYFGGFFFWLIDLFGCVYLPSWIYFHAVWHLMAGLGTYFTIQTQIAWRGEYHKAIVNLEKSKLIPFVTIAIKE